MLRASRRDTHGKKKLVLGFCFSFPLEQTARDGGTLIKWVKGFENAGVEGRDVVELLQDAFHRKARQRKTRTTILDPRPSPCA